MHVKFLVTGVREMLTVSTAYSRKETNNHRSFGKRFKDYFEIAFE